MHFRYLQSEAEELSPSSVLCFKITVQEKIKIPLCRALLHLTLKMLLIKATENKFWFGPQMTFSSVRTT